MTTPSYFTIVADYKAFIEDAASDSDYDPQVVPISATVTFTPLIPSGDVVLATNASPRPTGFIPAPVVAIIDPADGRLKLRTSQDAGASGGYGFAPVRLLCSTFGTNNDLLELDGPLFYRVAFTEVVLPNGRRGSITGFDFEAPNSADTVLNLITVSRQPGTSPAGITKIAPGAVRTVDTNFLQFSFGGVDIPEPVEITLDASGIGDSTAVGRAVITAADGTAAKAAINADVFVDPRDFGGVPNAADNTAALQDALAYVANNANKGTVIIPPGVWRYSEDLIIPRGCTLRGVGRGSKIFWSVGSSVNGLLATDPDARIIISTDSAIIDLVIDGGGVAKWGVQSFWEELLQPIDGSVAGKFYLNNVYLHGFTEVGYVMEGAQNPVFYNCTVRSTPIGWWFLNGAANADLFGCYYDNNVQAGGDDARVMLIKNDWTDRRLTEARLVQDNEEYEILYGGGGREIRVWGGVFEFGDPDYQVEIIDGYVGDQGGAIYFNGSQFGATPMVSLSHIYVGPNYVGSVILENTKFSGAQKTVIAESGRIIFRNHQIDGASNRNIITKTDISGSATISFDESARSLIRSTFDANVISNPAGGVWLTLGYGSLQAPSSLDLTKKCLSFSLPDTTNGIAAYMAGWQYYAQQYGTVTITFRLKNTTAPVLLRAIGPNSSLTTIGTFGDGEHQVVYELTGNERLFGFTSSTNSTVTGELDYFSVDHGVHAGAYPPSKTTFDGILKDADGNNWLGVERTGSAVNYVQIANSATSSGPQIKALGTDTNINVDLVPKGSGVARVGTDPILTATSQNTVTNKQLTSPKIDIIADTNGNGVLSFPPQSNTVNYLAVSGNVTSGRPRFTATGSDTNIGIAFIPKGSGDVQIYQPSGGATLNASGNDTNVDLNLTTKGAGVVKANGSNVLVSGGALGTPSSGTLTNATGLPQSGVVNLVTDLAAKEATANKNAANGYCGLDASGKVAAAQLPSYVDDVLEYANLAAFPGIGSSGVIYTALDTNKIYRWSGSTYVEISPSPGSTDSVTEGTTNLYFTNARADARITNAITTNVVQAYDADLAAFAGKTAPSGAVVGTTDAQALTYKDLTGVGNTFPTFNQNTTGSAATLTTGRTVRTDLGSTSTATFDGSTNITPGVTGTLPVGNGGTGVTTLTGLVKGTGTSAFTAATAGTDYVAPGGDLGTPSTGTLTNCTGLPVSGITASTSTALGVGSVELGHASDTTLSRASAGQLAVEGVQVATASNTLTLTNKTLTTPKINFVADSNGNGILGLTAAANPVNYISIGNNATGGRPTFTATGSDTNIGIAFIPKGSGDVQIYQPSGGATLNASGNDTNVDLNLTTKGTGVVKANSNPVGVKVAVPASATSTGVAGQWAVDSSYVYFATGTNTWVRAAVASW